MPRSPRVFCAVASCRIDTSAWEECEDSQETAPKRSKWLGEMPNNIFSHDIKWHMPIYPIWSSYHPLKVFFLRKLHRQYVLNFCDSSLAYFAASIISIQGWTPHLHSYFQQNKTHGKTALSGQFGGRIFLGTLGGGQCPPGNSKNLLKKKGCTKQNGPNMYPLREGCICCMYATMYQLHTSLLHAIYDVTNPVVSRWNSNAMCVHKKNIYIIYKGAEWLSTVFPLHSYDSVLKSG